MSFASYVNRLIVIELLTLAMIANSVKKNWKVQQ